MTVSLRPAAIIGTAVLLAACAQPRSAEAFCATYRSEKASFLATHGSRPGGDVLLQLASALQSVGDAGVVLDKLERVAPDEIDADMVVVRYSWNEIANSMGDQAREALHPTSVLGILLKNLLLSARTSGSWNRVGTYITTYCTT